MRLPRSWHSARVTVAIAAVTAAAWLIVSALGWQQAAAAWGGFVPARFGTDAIPVGALAPAWLTPLTATLVHAGLFHLLLNLLILLWCGRAVEALVGGPGLLLLYLGGAGTAAAADWLAAPGAAGPAIGAGGAISAVLAAYAILFGRNKVKLGPPLLAFWLNALWFAAAWLGLQLLIAFTFEVEGARIGLAGQAGGFLVGLLLARPLLRLRYRRGPRAEPHRRPNAP